jgi:hypothetical protein
LRALVIKPRLKPDVGFGSDVDVVASYLTIGGLSLVREQLFWAIFDFPYLACFKEPRKRLYSHIFARRQNVAFPPGRGGFWE